MICQCCGQEILELARDWPIGMMVERFWVRRADYEWWRPGVVIGHTKRLVKVRLLDTDWQVITRAEPRFLRRAETT
jgi:hypothetical protein